MPNSRSIRRSSSRQVWLAWLCAFCLLGFQGLGHWHRIAHGSNLGSGTPVVQKLARATTAMDGWGHQSGDADCHLFNQLSHDHVLSDTSVQACTPMQHLTPVAQIPADSAAAARWKRGARGPPLSA